MCGLTTPRQPNWLDRQPPAPLGTPTTQNGPTVARLHARAKAVDALAPLIMRLVRAFHVVRPCSVTYVFLGIYRLIDGEADGLSRCEPPSQNPTQSWETTSQHRARSRPKNNLEPGLMAVIAYICPREPVVRFLTSASLPSIRGLDESVDDLFMISHPRNLSSFPASISVVINSCG